MLGLRPLQALIRQDHADDEHRRREVDRSEVGQPVVGERVRRVVHWERESEPDDRRHDGGRPRPGQPLADAVPRERGDRDPRGDDERRGRYVEVADVVRDGGVEFPWSHPGERVDAEFEAAADEVQHEEDHPVPDERDAGERHQEGSVSELGSELGLFGLFVWCGLKGYHCDHLIAPRETLLTPYFSQALAARSEMNS